MVFTQKLQLGMLQAHHVVLTDLCAWVDAQERIKIEKVEVAQRQEREQLKEKVTELEEACKTSCPDATENTDPVPDTPYDISSLVEAVRRVMAAVGENTNGSSPAPATDISAPVIFNPPPTIIQEQPHGLDLSSITSLAVSDFHHDAGSDMTKHHLGYQSLSNCLRDMCKTPTLAMTVTAATPATEDVGSKHLALDPKRLHAFMDGRIAKHVVALTAEQNPMTVQAAPAAPAAPAALAVP